MAYYIEDIRQWDARTRREMDELLAREGVRLDAHVDYSIGAFDDGGALVAVGSAYRATLRSIAVDGAHRGEGLLGTIVTALIERQISRGYTEAFLYTKPDAAILFADIGFAEIARVENRLVFMSNRPGAFDGYIASLGAPKEGRSSAIVLNANPFTLGHLHLIETASRSSDAVHAFVVSEDVSLVPFDVRMKLVREGTAHLHNVFCHPAGNYMVSTATFPAYFLRAEDDVTAVQARLDVNVFARIARALGVTRRYVGEEPFSAITGIYNRVMKEALPALGIELIEIPRATEGDRAIGNGRAISASHVRQLIHDGEIEAIRPLVPDSTYDYFASAAASPVVDAIRRADHVVHD